MLEGTFTEKRHYFPLHHKFSVGLYIYEKIGRRVNSKSKILYDNCISFLVSRKYQSMQNLYIIFIFVWYPQKQIHFYLANSKSNQIQTVLVVQFNKRKINLVINRFCVNKTKFILEITIKLWNGLFLYGFEFILFIF